MAQQIINTGAVANDGTGDPLRTAFTETNNNFTEIYTAGPVDSNVRITNNTILTLNTNGNLVLAPNGIGSVISNVDVLPNTANVRNLGGSTKRWSTLYLQYADISNTVTVGGELTVGGNLTVSGNIIQVGNIVTDSLTIQLGNTAATASSANGAGITVGANDNIATLLYRSTGNVWTTNIGVSAVGNISAPYFIGNGSLLTGLAATYGNANVATFLANFGSNVIVTTGNVSAGNVLTSARVIANGEIQSGTGFFTGGYLSVNGDSDLANVDVSGTLAAAALTSPELTVNVIKSDDSTVVKIQDGIDIDGDALINGNITANYFFGNGSQLTGLSTSSISNGLSNVAIPTVNGNITVTANGTYTWSFDNNAQLNLPGGTGYISSSANTITIYSDAGEYNGMLFYDGGVDVYANGDFSIFANNAGAGNTWRFYGDGSTLFPTLTVQRGDNPSGTITGRTLLFGDATQEAIISTPDGSNADGINSQRLVINPGKGEDSNGGEGGDIYLWAGRGGNNNGSGGDVKIRGGQGMADGTGGYIRIEGGDSQANGYPGYIDITGGEGGNAEGGYVHLTGGQGATAGGPAVVTGGYGSNVGGDANIVGGFGGTNQGGNINITGGGSALGLPGYGNVNINSGASNWTFGNDGTLTLPDGSGVAGGFIYGAPGSAGGVTNGGTGYQQFYAQNDGAFVQTSVANAGTTFNTWQFGLDGNLTLPQGGIVYETAIPFGSLTGNTIALKPQGGTSADQQLLIYPTVTPGTDANHLHLTSGNLYNTELFLGNDNLYVKLANTGNIVLNANDSTGNVAQLVLGSDANVVLPTVVLGVGLTEQTTIRSQRKIIPPFQYSVEIDGATPTVVYTATDVNTTSMKVTMQVQHSGLGMEFFEVMATYVGSTDTYYTVSNRVAPPTIDASTVVVDLNGSNTMQITVTINSGAATSWVTYDAVEFGIPND